MDIGSRKKILRSEIEKSLKLFSISVSEKREKSKRLCLRGEHLLPQSGVCAFYAAIGFEPDLGLLVEKALQLRLNVLFPRICNDGMSFCPISSLQQLKPGTFGILAPETSIHHQEINVFFVPGLAFDVSGGRLGRGAGYYDRFLSFFPHAFKVGVCFERAVLPEIPIDEHDMAMDAILTEDRIIFCRDTKNPSSSDA